MTASSLGTSAKFRSKADRGSRGGGPKPSKRLERKFARIGRDFGAAYTHLGSPPTRWRVCNDAPYGPSWRLAARGLGRVASSAARRSVAPEARLSPCGAPAPRSVMLEAVRLIFALPPSFAVVAPPHGCAALQESRNRYFPKEHKGHFSVRFTWDGACRSEVCGAWVVSERRPNMDPQGSHRSETGSSCMDLGNNWRQDGARCDTPGPPRPWNSDSSLELRTFRENFNIAKK